MVQNLPNHSTAQLREDLLAPETFMRVNAVVWGDTLPAIVLVTMEGEMDATNQPDNDEATDQLGPDDLPHQQEMEAGDQIVPGTSQAENTLPR